MDCDGRIPDCGFECETVELLVIWSVHFGFRKGTDGTLTEYYGNILTNHAVIMHES